MNILDYCREYPKRAFDVGERVLSEGTQTGVIYVLIDGGVEVVKQGVSLARVSEPGSILGEIGALLDTPHMATVKAIEPTRFYVISDAQGFIKSHPDIGLILAKVLAQRLSIVTNNLAIVKWSVDTLIRHQTSRKLPVQFAVDDSFIGVLSVGTFRKGEGTRF